MRFVRVFVKGFVVDQAQPKGRCSVIGNKRVDSGQLQIVHLNSFFGVCHTESVLNAPRT